MFEIKSINSIEKQADTHRWLIDDQINFVRCHHRRLRIAFGHYNSARLQLFQQFICLLKIQRSLNGTINRFHGQRLKRSQRLQIRKIRFGKNYGVQRIRSPQFDEMYGVAESQRRMTAKDNARLPKIGAKTFRVNVFEMFQSGILDEAGMRKWFVWDVYFILLDGAQPFGQDV